MAEEQLHSKLTTGATFLGGEDFYQKIIDKARDNFLNAAAGKYLFADTVQIGDKQIRIKEVDNLSAANQDDINIVFSTIQGLHLRLNMPKENTITFEPLLT